MALETRALLLFPGQTAIGILKSCAQVIEFDCKGAHLVASLAFYAFVPITPPDFPNRLNQLVDGTRDIAPDHDKNQKAQDEYERRRGNNDAPLAGFDSVG